MSKESPIHKKARLYRNTGNDTFDDDPEARPISTTRYGSVDARTDDDGEDDDHLSGAPVSDASDLGGRKGRNKPWKAHGCKAGGSMHAANLYRHYRPDFRELAREYPGTSECGRDFSIYPRVYLGSVRVQFFV